MNIAKISCSQIHRLLAVLVQALLLVVGATLNEGPA